MNCVHPRLCFRATNRPGCLSVLLSVPRAGGACRWDSQLTMCSRNWRTIFLTCLLVSSKFNDDCSVVNADFHLVCQSFLSLQVRVSAHALLCGLGGCGRPDRTDAGADGRADGRPDLCWCGQGVEGVAPPLSLLLLLLRIGSVQLAAESVVCAAEVQVHSVQRALTFVVLRGSINVLASQRINDLEVAVLSGIQYTCRVSRQTYDKYYRACQGALLRHFRKQREAEVRPA